MVPEVPQAPRLWQPAASLPANVTCSDPEAFAIVYGTGWDAASAIAGSAAAAIATPASATAPRSRMSPAWDRFGSLSS